MMTTAAVGGERGGRGEVNNSYDNIIQSATTEGEGGVCRGAGEGGRQPVQEEGIN